MLLTFSALVASAGVGSLRHAWALHAGSQRLFTLLGVIAIASAVLLLGSAHGAWGVAVATIFAMATATVLLAHSLFTASPAKRREPREPSAPTVRLASGGWRGAARRTGVFLLVVPGACAASMLVAMATQAAARASGMLEANSITLGLLLFPIVWALLAMLVMLEERLAAMLRPLLLLGGGSAALFLLLS